MHLSTFDMVVFGAYLVTILAIGLWNRKQSARDLESYFLADKTTPWWMLGLSGSVSNFDIAGTMWLVGMVFTLHFRAFNMFWIFAFLNAAFLMSYLAMWIRRTEVMTAAELLKIRFGDEPGGKCARTATAAIIVIFLLFAVGYSYQGVGKFVATYVPFTPLQCASVLMVTTGVYVMLGGFKSVILTDVIQAILLNVCGVIVAIVAFKMVDVAALHAEVSTSLLPAWRLPEMAEAQPAYRKYELFGALFLMYLAKGIIGSMGSPGGTYEEQRFLATRNARDAAKAGLGWGLFLSIRWALIGGIAFLAVSLSLDVNDQETVLPNLINLHLPTWLKPFLITGLLAAFMSTFSSTLNAACSIMTRDLVQPFAPKISEHRLVFFSYFFTAAFVIIGIVIGSMNQSIEEIWKWMQLALLPSILIPNMMRWYWWRMNGWGFTIGAFTGAVLAMTKLALKIDLPELVYFPVINLVILVACVVGSLCTRPVEEATLVNFYRKVHPRGLWGPVRKASGLSDAELDGPRGLERPRNIILNIAVGTVGLYAMFVLPLYAIGHWGKEAVFAALTAAVAAVILYFTWYRRLPEETPAGETEAADAG